MANNSMDFWSVTAANNDANSPNGAQNNWTGADINDWAREAMAVVRSWYDDPEWLSVTRDLNTGVAKTIDQLATNQFRVNGCDATAYFTAGRRVRMRLGVSPPYQEAHVLSSVFSSPNTTVTIVGSNVPATFQDDGADVYFAKSIGASSFLAFPAVGDIRQVAGIPSAAAVDGWLECDGGEYNATTYASLAAVCNSTGGFGTGYYDEHPVDGTPAAGNFRVPDMRGRAAVGFWEDGDPDGDYDFTVGGGGDNTDTWVGEKKHALTEAEGPTHDHGGATSVDGEHVHDLKFNPSSANDSSISKGNTDTPDIGGTAMVAAGDHSHTITGSGSGTAHENRQPSIVMGFVIYSGVIT